MKTFTTSFLNHFSILNKAIIGLEFEFYSRFSFYSTIEVLNNRLDKDIRGTSVYHPDLKTSEKTWLLTPDWSGGMNMAELITHPMPYSEAKIYMTRILNILDEISETNENTGLHINISFTDKDIITVNPLKLITAVDEEKIYSMFPDRKDTVYAKSVIDLIPITDNKNIAAVASEMDFTQESKKYYGINFRNLTDGRIEYRYIGGEDYTAEYENIQELMDYFIYVTRVCMDEGITNHETEVLQQFIDTRREQFQSFSDYKEFSMVYPNITFQVDRNTNDTVCSTYFSENSKKIFYIFKNCDFTEGIINIDTETKNIEIVNAEVNVGGSVKDTVFVDCDIDGGNIYDCTIASCNISDCIITKTVIAACDVNGSKVIYSEADSDCILRDSYFADGFLDGKMIDGVFRSGRIGENAVISDGTEKSKDLKDFFGFGKKADDNYGIIKKKK